MNRIPLALTIAGSDSGGGAGIQADLKTFSALGVFGMSVITALTAQNTLGVQGIYDISPEFIGQQIDSIFQDMGTDAIKTGMLSNSSTIRMVAQKMREYKVNKLVVDPVMVAKGGDRLLRAEAEDTLREALLPLCLVVTPNIPEAEVISGISIHSLMEMKKAARIIHQKGPKNVVIKGGHLEGDQSIDLLYDGQNFLELSAPRVNTTNTHGTGCTFASAITAHLAKGLSIPEAVENAKEYLTTILKLSSDLQIGRGVGPLNHLAPFLPRTENKMINVITKKTDNDCCRY
ncbi:MAG: Hydroxymethylpyrimidine/phosphomethylpyrimidine kinase [candidate division WS2 bacterium]|nr:Hydroxymethylpyrimidine/phosphomethylpyrimidine kinase [Candidatus Lithacetigena glycinireducens]